MSSCTTTVPNSVRNSDPVGHTSRQPASVQCLHTSLDISQRKSVRWPFSSRPPGSSNDGIPRSTVALLSTPGCCEPNGLGCSMNATCRQVLAPSAPVLSYDEPSRFMPSSGTPFHSLHATSHALQPMQIDVSVKKPLRGGGSTHAASMAGLVGPASWLRQKDIRQPPSGSGEWSGVECGEPVRSSLPVIVVVPARDWYSATSRSRSSPLGRRPGTMSQLPALLSWIWTFGSSATPSRSLAASPLTTAS